VSGKAQFFRDFGPKSPRASVLIEGIDGQHTAVGTICVMPRPHDQISSLRYILTIEVMRRNALIAAVVGCVLTAANHWDALVREPPNAKLGAKIFANFLIPFVVSSTSAALNRRAGREK
jgi:hypothetical protein